jgi:dihydrofolate synthase/folylpolyglutamate synthase
MISDEDLNNYLGQIYTITNDEHISLSFFEHMILVAFLYFRDQHVDYAVIEVGLGGKYDATNVFTQPIATVITTISDDHRHLL